MCLETDVALTAHRIEWVFMQNSRAMLDYLLGLGFFVTITDLFRSASLGSNHRAETILVHSTLGSFQW
jgi:hypothetical protein